MTVLVHKSKYILSVLMALFVMLNYSLSTVAVETDTEVTPTYDTIEFIAKDEAEEEEIIHLLLAKLSYDYLDGYEGKSVAEYVNEHPEDYGSEIWTNSGITYKALYNSIVGDWKIYKVFNRNDITGFYGVAFISEGRVIFALRGSDMFTDEFPLDESNDWIGTDFEFAIMNELSHQFDDFDKSYEKLLIFLKRDGYGDYRLTLTGHSLGGALVTYGSLTTDAYGYSFDGACGHVIDLIYMEEYLKIDNFTGVDDIDNVRFINYTDASGYVVADLIQHMGAGYFYQIDRESNLTNLTEDNYISQIADAGSHHIWSCLSYEGNKVYFNNKVDINDAGYTYMPEDYLFIDINKNVVEATLEEFDIFAPWEFIQNFDTEYVINSALGNIKNGRVVLASMAGGELFADDKMGHDEKYDVDTVMYGGAGDNQLIGGLGNDVFLPGKGEFNTLLGKEGEDTYVIDAVPNQLNFIMDIEDEKVTIILRNPYKDFRNNMKMGEDGVIYLADGQEITIGAKSEFEDVYLYVYSKDRLLYLGTYEELLNKSIEE